MRRWVWIVAAFIVLTGGIGAFVLRGGDSPTDAGDPSVEDPLPTLSGPGGSQSHLPKAGRTTSDPIDKQSQVVRLGEDHKPGSGSTLSLQDKETKDDLDDKIPSIDASGTPQPVDASMKKQSDSDKLGLAVVPFKQMGEGHEIDAGASVARLVEAAIDSDLYNLYERSQLKPILDERNLRESDLVDATTATQVGRLAGIRYLLVGELMRLGGQYHLTARVVDCTDGKIHGRGDIAFASMAEVRGRLEELIVLLKLGKGARPLDTLVDAVNPAGPFKVTIRTAQDKQTFLEGDSVSFVVEADRNCFITLVTIDPAGRATLLLPNAWNFRAFVKAKEPVQIPSAEAKFVFKARPPHGVTLVKAIATLDHPLRLRGVNEKKLADEKFMDLGEAKGLSVEGKAGEAPINGDPLAALRDLNPNEWTTAELTIITAGKDAIVPTAKPAPSGNSQHPKPGVLAPATPEAIPQRLSFEPANADPNDKISARWKELMAGRLIASTPLQSSNLLSSKARLGSTAANSLLVIPRANAASASEPKSLLQLVRTMKSINSTDAERNGEDSLAQIRKQQDAQAVVPDLALSSQALPATRMASIQWALRNRFSDDYDTGYYKVADRVRAIDGLPLIGLVDASCNIDDPRIAHAVWTNPRETANNQCDDDGNGLTDDVHGWNFVTDSPRLCEGDTFSHGTFVASILVGQPQGLDTDVIGLIPQARFVPAVALTVDPNRPGTAAQGKLSNVLCAIAYVVDQGATVVNLSFGAPVSPEQLAELNRLPLWDELERRGVILVCAAGNDNADNDTSPVFPANLPRSNILSVMACDAGGRPGRSLDTRINQWVPFSNHGVKSVHLAAPGTLILGAAGRDVFLLSGTSYAAAHVTAMVAVAHGKNKAQAPATALALLAPSLERRPVLDDQCSSKCLIRWDLLAP